MRDNLIIDEVFPTFICREDKRRVLEENKHTGKPTDREESQRNPITDLA